MKSRSEVLPSVQAKIRLRVFVSATHSYEPLDELRQLRGHVSMETSACYLHPVVAQATPPLNDLLARPRDPS